MTNGLTHRTVGGMRGRQGAWIDLTARWARLGGGWKALVLSAPIFVGLAIKLFGGWRYAAGLEAGGMLWMATVAPFAMVMLIRRDARLSATGRPDLTRRRWLWIPLAAILGLGAGVRGVAQVADWFVAPDEQVAIIQRERLSRSATAVLIAGGKWLKAPMFTTVVAEPGSARILTGHFSGDLLLVQQPWPEP